VKLPTAVFAALKYCNFILWVFFPKEFLKLDTEILYIQHYIDFLRFTLIFKFPFVLCALDMNVFALAGFVITPPLFCQPAFFLLSFSCTVFMCIC
jgi:hypothetical protein